MGCLGIAIAIATMLPSCVDPYASNHGSSYTVSTYHPGYQVRALPPGYRSETIGGTRYYNHNGTYYQPRSGGYVVVEAPRPRYESTRYGSTSPRYESTPYESARPRYDDSYSHYDRPDDRREAIITALPRGYREVNYQNGRYYQHNGVYYQQRGSGYIIVNRPY